MFTFGWVLVDLNSSVSLFSFSRLLWRRFVRWEDAGSPEGFLISFLNESNIIFRFSFSQGPI